MEQKVYVRPRFRKLKKNEYMQFYNSLRDARKINKHGLFVLLRDPEVYLESENFLIGNGIAGFSIKDEEMISVHKNNKKAQESGVSHILPKLVRCALKYGAKFCDCYGEFLVNYYMKCGYICVCRVPFDYIEDNPDNWDYKQFGKPDVFVLVRGVKTVAELDLLRQKNALLGFDEIAQYIPTIKNYDEALVYRDKIYEKIKSLSYKQRIKILKEEK